MARPTAKPALAKAPAREHPVAPALATTPPAAAAVQRIETIEPATSSLRMFSARIDPSVVRRTKLYAVETDSTLQEITEAALVEYMENHPVR